MKNKLTVNTLALGNLKQRRRQYVTMIIGIDLAMVFSSSVVFFMAAAKETFHAQFIDENGYQDLAVNIPSFTQNDWEQAKQDGSIDDYATVDILGYAYKNDKFKRLGTAVGRANDKFREISNQQLIEGRLPEAKNEIAVESEALKKLEYRDAEIGSTITLKFMLQNGEGYGETIEKDYVLTGILKDKKSNFSGYFFTEDNYDNSIPAIFVADNTVLESGTTAKQIAYLTLKEYDAYFNYLENKYSEPIEYDVCASSIDTSSVMSYSNFSNGDLIIFVALLLAFASCVAIVNSFNNNLKERKQQIGLLRAVGTTRRQIIRIFGREAFIIALIATPLSIAISYFIVYFALKFVSDNAVVSKSIWILPTAAVINLSVVMFAALLPLISASHISPMQAIRDVKIQRKSKVKKIHSKMQYKPAVHLAERNGRFYKGSKAAVGILLCVCVIISAFGFSYLSYEKKNKTVVPYDYSFWSGTEDVKLSDVDKQNIVSNPLVEKVEGRKSISSAIKSDYSNMFMRIMNYDKFLYDFENEDYSFPKNAEEFRQRIQNNKADNSLVSEEFEGLNAADEVWNMNIDSYEQSKLEELEKEVYDGKIDYNKLRAGEEVILVMPKKAELTAKLYNNGHGMGTDYNYDDEVGTKTGQYKTVMTEESSYKAGDEIEIYSKNDKAFKTVKVGAIVSCNKNRDRFDIVSTYNPQIITSNEGILNFDKDAGYEDLYISLYDKPDEQTDMEFSEFLEEYSLKCDGFVSSTYEDNKNIEKSYRSSVAAMLVVLIIGFAICASIINNSITAQIRENKRVIGTLRAEGASQSELVKSYFLRMLSMYSWGAGMGFGLFFVSYIVFINVSEKYFDIKPSLAFNPWVSVIMVAVLFVVCFINILSKIRKQMKNSIVENIREL